LEALARGHARTDHARAEKLARGIKDEAIRHDALFYLAVTFPAKDLDRALAIARGFKDEARQAGALAAIVTTCANAGDFSAATTVAQSIGVEKTRIERLKFVLRQVFRKDEMAAKAWYAGLPDGDRAELKSEYDGMINPPWKLREAAAPPGIDASARAAASRKPAFEMKGQKREEGNPAFLFQCTACSEIYQKCSSCGHGAEGHDKMNHVPKHDGCKKAPGTNTGKVVRLEKEPGEGK
jgi:hypothetical protein